MIAALEFGPLPLYLAQRAEPELKHAPLVIADEQRVLHANAAAKRHGVTPGMRLVGAHMRVSSLEVRSFAEPDVDHAWLTFLRELGQYTPWLESGARGRALLRVDLPDAEELARLYDVRAGIADDVETAELAALSSGPGSVREVVSSQLADFLARLPLRFLKGVGLSEANLTRLNWLGLATAADLAGWNAQQIQSYLGEEGRILLPYLHGPRRLELRPSPLPASVRRSFAFSEPVREPGQIAPAIDRLATELERALAGRAARRLTLTTTLGGTQRHASRLAKRPLQQARHIRQQMLFALQESHAEGHPIDRITVELSAPERVGVQDGLWPQRERRQRALEATIERFPTAPRRLVWRDPNAQAADLAWTWEGYADERGAYSEASVVERGGALGAAARQGGKPALGAAADTPAVASTAVPLFAGQPADASPGEGMERERPAHATPVASPPQAPEAGDAPREAHDAPLPALRTSRRRIVAVHSPS